MALLLTLYKRLSKQIHMNRILTQLLDCYTAGNQIKIYICRVWCDYFISKWFRNNKFQQLQDIIKDYINRRQIFFGVNWATKRDKIQSKAIYFIFDKINIYHIQMTIRIIEIWHGEDDKCNYSHTFNQTLFLMPKYAEIW